METNQPLDDNFSTGLVLNTASRGYLKETAKWAYFLAIIGFIVVALMVIGALSIGTILGSMPGGSDTLGMPLGVFSGLYLVMALLYFFPVLYLYRFAAKMKVALREDDQEQLDRSFENIKSCYKFMGILMIVILAMYALIFVGAALFGASAAF